MISFYESVVMSVKKKDTLLKEGILQVVLLQGLEEKSPI